MRLSQNVFCFREGQQPEGFFIRNQIGFGNLFRLGMDGLVRKSSQKVNDFFPNTGFVGEGVTVRRTEAIYQGYKLAFPEHAQELDEWMMGMDEYADW